MTKNFQHCVEDVSHAMITIEEKGKKIVILNPNKEKHCRTRVDGCVITKGRRADFVVSKINHSSAIVELKGKNINDACEQLFATLIHVDCKHLLQKRCVLIIVCSTTSGYSTLIAKAKERARRFGVRLQIYCRSVSLAMEDFFKEPPGKA